MNGTTKHLVSSMCKSLNYTISDDCLKEITLVSDLCELNDSSLIDPQVIASIVVRHSLIKLYRLKGEEIE